jgi:hypothetical protein
MQLNGRELSLVCSGICVALVPSSNSKRATNPLAEKDGPSELGFWN